jgi:hypothetical protein
MPAVETAVNHPLIPGRLAPGQPIIAPAQKLDVELLPGFHTVQPPEFRWQHYLPSLKILWLSSR